MKILYLAHYREGTGWSQAAIDYILSMDSAGLDVVCRPIKLNSNNPSIPTRIQQLEQKSLSGCEVCIQHVLPHYMDYNGNLKNIGLFVAETDSIQWTSWPTHLNTMDEVWVPNKEMIQTCKNSGVKTTLRIVPHASDVLKYKAKYPTVNLPIPDDTFIFYFIGEFNRRKNITGLLEAFHTEFDRNENVALLIKTNKSGLNSTQCFQALKVTADKVKEHLRIYHSPHLYHKEIFISDYLPEDQLLALHKRCDCFVLPTFGDAWSIPCFDAMGFGNLIVSNNVGGPADFLKRDNGSSLGLMVENTTEPAFGMDVVFKELNTGRENWKRPNINSLRKQMRKAFEMSKRDKEFNSKEMQKNAERYSYKNVGNLILLYLKGSTNENSKKIIQTVVGR